VLGAGRGVSALPGNYEAAALDLTGRVVTVLIWLLGIGLVVGGVLAIRQGGTPAGAILLAVGGSLVAVHWWLRRREPRAYVVEEGALHVERRSAAPRRFAGPVRNVRRGALGWRVAGDGGGYGYLGRFRAEGRTVSAYVTDRAKVVLLDVGEESLALSPDDPDEFVERFTSAR